MNLDQWLPDVLPYVPGCPDPVAIDHVRRAARTFCERTRFWLVDSLPVLTVAGLDTYPIDLEDQTERVALLRLWLDDSEVPVANAQRGGAWARRTDGCSFAYAKDAYDIVLRPVPLTDGQEIRTQLVLKPTLDVTELPDDFAEFRADIAYGAIASLCRMPPKMADWSDAGLAAANQAMFDDRIATVGWKVSRGFSSAKVADSARNRFL